MSASRTPLTDALCKHGPGGFAIAPASLPFEALCRSLEADQRLLVRALRECVAAMQAEFEAMGDDWKDQPIMQRKNRTLIKVRALLSKVAAKPS